MPLVLVYFRAGLALLYGCFINSCWVHMIDQHMFVKRVRSVMKLEATRILKIFWYLFTISQHKIDMGQPDRITPNLEFQPPFDRFNIENYLYENC